MQAIPPGRGTEDTLSKEEGNLKPHFCVQSLTKAHLKKKCTTLPGKKILAQGSLLTFGLLGENLQLYVLINF
jgi:hypothetical protein